MCRGPRCRRKRCQALADSVTPAAVAHAVIAEVCETALEGAVFVAVGERALAVGARVGVGVGGPSRCCRRSTRWSTEGRSTGSRRSRPCSLGSVGDVVRDGLPVTLAGEAVQIARGAVHEAAVHEAADVTEAVFVIAAGGEREQLLSNWPRSDSRSTTSMMPLPSRSESASAASKEPSSWSRSATSTVPEPSRSAQPAPSWAAAKPKRAVVRARTFIIIPKWQARAPPVWRGGGRGMGRLSPGCGGGGGSTLVV